MVVNNKYSESELTEKLIGISFEIYNKIGSRYPEKIYQNAFENKLQELGLKYDRELYCKLELDGKRIGFFKLDFLVEKRVIVELKVRNEIYKSDYGQLLTYMRINEIAVGLILVFAKEKVKVKRLVL